VPALVESAPDIEKPLGHSRAGADRALVAAPDLTTAAHGDFRSLAAKQGVPAVYAFSYLVAAGGLLPIAPTASPRPSGIVCRPHTAGRRSRRTPGADPDQVRDRG
jgi:hypothetical protein